MNGVAGKCADAHDTSSPTRGDASMQALCGKINRVRELLLCRDWFALARWRLRLAARLRGVEVELLHVPRAGRAALGAETAVQADVLVLHHNARGFEPVLHVKILREILCGRVEAITELSLFAVLGERDAIHRADIDTSVALDTRRR